MNKHPTAIISRDAKIDESVEIGAYALVEGVAQIGSGSVIEPYARIHCGARIGKNCRICSFTTIAGEPQDLHFDSSIKSFVEIGDGSVVREGSTIHRATRAGEATRVGKGALLMANSHIGHDCSIGDNFILGCFSAMAGHCVAGDNIFVSGGVMIHQKVRIGDGVIVSGGSASSLDIPPFVNAFGRNDMAGLNLIGMSRRGFSRESIADIKNLYALVYSDSSVRKNALKALEEGAARTAEGKIFLEFFKAEGRHFLHPRHAARGSQTS